MQALLNGETLKFFRKIVSAFIVLTFLTSLIVAPAGAQVLPIINAPQSATNAFAPPVLLGLKIHPENPLLFDFIVDQGQAKLSTEELKEETTKLVKYFLAALTIPDKEVWVNLSPTEKDRIIPDVLGQTTMGKTMLEQDYVLKQLASSLTNPETELGKKYWDQVNGARTLDVRRSTLEKTPSVQPPATSDFNKVWIMPAKAEVLESNGIVLVGEKRLKVMLAEEMTRTLEGGRWTLEKNNSTNDQRPASSHQTHQPPASSLQSNIFRTTILPTIEKAVNEGKDFADVRQIYNSVILAAWYKKALKESLLGKIYADKGKVAGVETDDKAMKQRIYEQYLAAFKKGAYNLIKEEADENGELIPRKYFSGGISPLALGVAGTPILEKRRISDAEAENVITAGSPALVQVYTATENSEGNAVAVAQEATAVDGGGHSKLDASSSAIKAVSKLAASVAFSLAILFPTVYPIEVASQSKEIAQIYYQDQAERDKNPARVKNISAAQQELKKNLDQMIKDFKKRHNGDLVPNIVDGPQLKRILSNNLGTFDEIAAKVKQGLGDTKDSTAKASLQKEVLRWVYLYVHENTQYDTTGVDSKDPNSSDLRNAIVGKNNISYTPKRTLICQSATILATMILNDFGFSTAPNDVSAIQIKINFQNQDMSQSGGHVANLIKLANGEVWIFDLTQGWRNQINVNVPHKSVVTKEGRVIPVKERNSNLGNITGWTMSDISKQQSNALIMSDSAMLGEKLKKELNTAVDQYEKDKDQKRLEQTLSGIVSKVDDFLNGPQKKSLESMKIDDVYIRGQFFVNGKDEGPQGIINSFIKLKNTAVYNLNRLKQVQAQGNVVSTISISPADINHLNTFAAKMNEITKSFSTSNDKTIKSLQDIQSELSGSKIADIENRAKASGTHGDQIVQMIKNMRMTVEQNITAAQNNIVVAQLKTLADSFNKWANDKDWNNAKPRLQEIDKDLDRLIKANPRLSENLKAEIARFKLEIKNVINLRNSRGAQNDILVPALALENIEPQLLAIQTVASQEQSTAASSGVFQGEIIETHNSLALVGASAYPSGTIVFGDNRMANFPGNPFGHTAFLNVEAPFDAQGIRNQLRDRPSVGTQVPKADFSDTLVTMPDGSPVPSFELALAEVIGEERDEEFKQELMAKMNAALAATKGKDLNEKTRIWTAPLKGLLEPRHFKKVVERLGLKFNPNFSQSVAIVREHLGLRKEEKLTIDIVTGINAEIVEAFLALPAVKEEMEKANFEIGAIHTTRLVMQDSAPAASSALDEERAKLVGQTLTDQQEIFNAVALLKEGDSVSVTYSHFDGARETTESPTGFIKQINGQSIGKKGLVIDGTTIVRVHDKNTGETKGFMLKDVVRITIDSLAASITVDVQDVPREEWQDWVLLLGNTLRSLGRTIEGMNQDIDFMRQGSINEVKIAQIGDFRWVGIHSNKSLRWYELIVDSKNRMVSYGVTRKVSLDGKDYNEITFNVLKNVQNRRISQGQPEINSHEILDGRLRVMESLTGINRFVLTEKQINGPEAIERGAVIFYLLYGFDFLNPVRRDDMRDIITRVRNNERVEQYELSALAFSGKMTYTLQSQSEAGTFQPQPVQQQQAQDNRKPTDVGGIDFDPTNMNLQIKRDGKGVPLPLPEQNLEQINIQGLFPVIINITPINAQTLPIFLGQAPKEPAREPELAASSAS